MSAIAKDFDRLAQLDDGGWTQNNHYHKFLLRHVPTACEKGLEVGCGTGAFSRHLARRAKEVLAIDLSSEMISVAAARSANHSNLSFRCADVMTCDLRDDEFDCIVTIATLHHLPLEEVLWKLRRALRPGGMLLVVDLFEPERDLSTIAGWRDTFLNMFAMGTSVSLRLFHNGRLRPPKEVRAAWEEHGKTDSYPSVQQVRALCQRLLPAAKIKQHLLWRYSIVWRKSWTQHVYYSRR